MKKIILVLVLLSALTHSKTLYDENGEFDYIPSVADTYTIIIGSQDKQRAFFVNFDLDCKEQKTSKPYGVVIDSSGININESIIFNRILNNETIYFKSDSRYARICEDIGE